MENKKKNKTLYWTSLFLGILGGVIGLVLVLAIIYGTTDFLFFKTTSCSSHEGLNYCFVDAESNLDTYLSIVSGFYETIISIMALLLAIVATFSFIIIRSSTKDYVDEIIEGKVERYFQTKDGEELLENIQKDVKDSEEISIQNRIDRIESILQEEGILELNNLEVDDEEETE